MNLIDFVILIPVVYGAWKGFKKGLVIEIFILLALFVGLYIGINFSDKTASWLKSTFEWNSSYLPVIAFTITFLAVGAMLYFAGKVVERMVKVVQLGMVNKIFGALLGALKIVYIVSCILILLESYDERGNFFQKTTKDDSLLYHPIIGFSKATLPSLKQSTIFVSNFYKSESDSLGMEENELEEAKNIADSLNVGVKDAGTLKDIYEKYH